MDKHGKKRPMVTTHVVPDDVGEGLEYISL